MELSEGQARLEQARKTQAASAKTSRRTRVLDVSSAMTPNADNGRRRPLSQSVKTGPVFPLVELPAKERRLVEVVSDIRLTVLDLMYAQRPWPLVLLGETGSGKTCASLCMIDWWGGWFTTLADLQKLFNAARDGRIWWPGPNGGQCFERELWVAWSKCSLCVIDDIGARQPTDAQFETLLTAIDKREGKPLVVTSNLTVPQLGEVYDARIASRLNANEATVLTLKGDRRLVPAAEPSA